MDRTTHTIAVKVPGARARMPARAGIPDIPCYAITRTETNPRHKDCVFASFRCPFCRDWHHHMLGRDDYEPQHRSRHCWTAAGRQRHPLGYYIEMREGFDLPRCSDPSEHSDAAKGRFRGRNLIERGAK